MPEEPQIKLMTYKRRQGFFYVLLVIFVITLPAIIFYMTGYRIDFADSENRIVTTGGIYITTDNLDVDVYLDEEVVRRPRLFRSAYYIQNIASGSHRIVVQRDGLHTWVKELPVDPYIVIEAAAFNMPVTPQVRLIPEFIDQSGVAIYDGENEVATPLMFATTTNRYLVSTSTIATSTLLKNPEYDFVSTLFSTSSATSSTVISRIREQVERFGFATTSPLSTTTTEEMEFVQKGNIRLIEADGELFATWVGSVNTVPYYFCIANAATSSVALRYGTHVALQVEEQRLSTSTSLLIDTERICRQQIRIDRMQQDILYYDFVPGATDLVLLQLNDGLYVTEIDDRAWQNSQLLYPGNNYEILVHSDKIFLRIDGHYVELFTKIES